MAAKLITLLNITLWTLQFVNICCCTVFPYNFPASVVFSNMTLCVNREIDFQIWTLLIGIAVFCVRMFSHPGAVLDVDAVNRSASLLAVCVRRKQKLNGWGGRDSPLFAWKLMEPHVLSLLLCFAFPISVHWNKLWRQVSSIVLMGGWLKPASRSGEKVFK